MDASHRCSDDDRTATSLRDGRDGCPAAAKDAGQVDSHDQVPFAVAVVGQRFVIASMMKRVDFGVYYATSWVNDGTFRELVEDYGGQITLGVGTEVAGVLTEGISVSTLADLDEFIEMGEKAEELTGYELGPVSMPIVTLEGSYPDSIQVSMDTLTPWGFINYTTDGTEPTGETSPYNLWQRLQYYQWSYY